MIIWFSLLIMPGCNFTGFAVRDNFQRWSTYHVLAPGEDLRLVARNYQVSLNSLMLLNGIHDSSKVPTGSRILIAYQPFSSLNKSYKGYGKNYQGGVPKLKGGGRIGWPIAGGRIVSKFGPRGFSFHDGIDIAARAGTPVYAAHSGVVVYSGSGLRGYGNLIVLRGKKGFLTVYAHNRRLLRKKGARVRRGEQIAEVGSTGHSSGPHLHFEIRMRDKKKRYVAVDPLPFFSDSKRIKPRFRFNESLTPLLVKR